MEEDELVIVLVEPILSGHREGEFVEVAVDVIDHVPLDVTIDDDLGHRRRHVGGRGDRDGEARIVILVDAVAHPVLSHEVHARATLEGDEACARRKVGSLLGRLLLEGVHAGLKCLELRLQVGELVGPGTGGGHHGERYATEKGPAEPLGIGHYRFSHRSLELRLPPSPAWTLECTRIPVLGPIRLSPC